ncbi:MAG: DedA family protein [Phycisphaerae bacterium]|nr:DedA family protein [Gemmatimonadaceae bacterium]
MLELLDWLGSLPVALLYLAIGAAAFVENIFPPLPADTAIALGAFVAARGESSAFGVWLATMIGNVGGAMMMYYVGHRFGMPWLEKKIPAFRGGGARKFEAQYKRYGVPGLVVSRFLPGVRAIVPPIAGAMHIGALRAALSMGIASGVWYAIVCVLAFRAGANAEVLLAKVASSQKVFGIAAAVIVVIVIGIWLVRRKKKQ